MILSQEQLQQQSAMYALMELLSDQGQDEQQLLRFGLTLAAEALGMPIGILYQLDRGTPVVKASIEQGNFQATNNDTLSNSSEILNAVFNEGLASHDQVGLHKSLALQQPLNDFGGMLTAPMQINKSQRGGVIFLTEDSAAFTEDTKEFLQFFAHWLQQKTLQHELQKALQIAENEIAQLAFYDSLTTLPNKRLLMDRLAQTLLLSQRDRTYGGLVFIDLDDFKMLNETLGHEAGDQLLQTTAMRLIDCLREADTVARLGGDEFVVMLDQLETQESHATEKIEKVGGKIIDALNQPYYINGQEYFNTPTLGATLFNGVTDRVDDVLKRADIAMYQAKYAGKNCLRFFDGQIQASLIQRNKLEEELRVAIAEQQFELYYQPQMDRDGWVTGAEALIRWIHPERGFVSPMEFIPLAESTGLITEIGLWVLETACEQLTTWAAVSETALLNLSVNVSARQFQQANFVEQVLNACEKSGANPQRLKLELTESMLVNDVDDVITKMSQLKDQEVSFSLDDFGTGFSSLSFLKLLPLNQLKIDKSFVQDVLTNNNDAVIARTIVALAKSLGLNVIAEGVEYDGQKVFLAEIGCYDYQGYLFSRPLNIDDFNQFCLAHTAPKTAALDIRTDSFGLN